MFDVLGSIADNHLSYLVFTLISNPLAVDSIVLRFRYSVQIGYKV